uniref:Uncharacterized protein n=1 Tax=Monopterus albus TaxID=43700 RepID=A0A3Q3JKE4_MONAL
MKLKLNIHDIKGCCLPTQKSIATVKYGGGSMGPWVWTAADVNMNSHVYKGILQDNVRVLSLSQPTRLCVVMNIQYVYICLCMVITSISKPKTLL